MSTGDDVKRVHSREFIGCSPIQPAGTGVKLVKTRVVFVGIGLKIFYSEEKEWARYTT